MRLCVQPWNNETAMAENKMQEKKKKTGFERFENQDGNHFSPIVVI